MSSEAALEPDLPIIDPRHHFCDTPQLGRYLLPELPARQAAADAQPDEAGSRTNGEGARRPVKERERHLL